MAEVSFKGLTGVWDAQREAPALIIRTFTKGKIGEREALVRVARVLEEEINKVPAHLYAEVKDNRLKDLKELRCYDIVYGKQDRVGDWYFTQVVCKPREDSNITNDGILYNPGKFDNILSRIYGHLGGGECPEDFVYCINAIGLGESYKELRGYKNVFQANELFDNTVDKTVAVNLSFNVNKGYRGNDTLSVLYEVFSTITEAVEARKQNTVATVAGGGFYSSLKYKLTRMNDGLIKFKPILKGKFTLKFVDGVGVLYDGEKVYEAAKPYFKEAAKQKIKVINLMQYSRTPKFIGLYTCNPSFRLLTVWFVPKDAIDIRRSCFTPGQVTDSASIAFPKKKGMNDFPPTMFVVPFTENKNIMMIVPVSKDAEETKKAIDYCLSSCVGLGDRFSCDVYRSLFQSDFNDKDSEINSWFSRCIDNGTQGKAEIIRKYKKMKAGLEKEIRQLNIYFAENDLSKCTPIPQIKMDEILRKRFNSTLFILPEWYQIDCINRKEITRIEGQEARIRFLGNRKGDFIYKTIPLGKYYNPRTNKIVLEYKKLKGDN